MRISGVVVRRILDYDERWDEENQRVIKLEQESDENSDEIDFEYDSHSSSFGYYDNRSSQEQPDNQGPTLISSDDEHNVVEEDGNDELVFTPWGEREKVRSLVSNVAALGCRFETNLLYLPLLADCRLK